MPTKPKLKPKRKTKTLARTCKGRTRQGNPCRNKPMRGRDVCAQHPDQGNEGRPTKLTPENANQVIAALQTGVGLEKAARSAGVRKQTLLNWLKQGETDYEAELETDQAGFFDRLTRARANVHVGLAARILLAGREDVPGDWKANAWALERLAPDEWGQHAVIDHLVSGMVDVEVLNGKQAVDTPLEAREQILAVLAAYEPVPPDAEVVEE